MTIGTMITNYWLGTFSLVSLQLITVVSSSGTSSSSSP
jgi:hypothetical protein